MDDSLFLPPDLNRCRDPKKAYTELSSHLRKIENSLVGDHTSYKGYKKELGKLMRNLYISLDRPENILEEPTVEKVSNVTMEVRPLLEELDDYVTSRMLNWSLDVKNLSLIWGLTRNLHNYIISKYNLSQDQIDATVEQGKYFLYNTRTHDLCIFNKELLPTIIRHVLFNGENVDHYYMLQRVKSILK